MVCALLSERCVPAQRSQRLLPRQHCAAHSKRRVRATALPLPLTELAGLGESIQMLTDGLSILSPSFLAPAVSTIGSDFADLANLQLGLPGTIRLGVRRSTDGIL